MSDWAAVIIWVAASVTIVAVAYDLDDWNSHR